MPNTNGTNTNGTNTNGTGGNLTEAQYAVLAEDGLFDLPPATLARLALSQSARDLADQARALVPTYADRRAGPGAFIDDARRLVAAAGEVLERAVVCERLQGRSWEQVGEALGTTRQSAHERFADGEERWHRAWDRPLVAPPGRLVASPQLPDGADAPRDWMRWLDEWCERHHEPADPAVRAHQVSAGLQDDTHRTLKLIAAVTAQASRLARAGAVAGGDRIGDRISERTFWERKVRLMERLVAERPEDTDAQAQAAAARAKLTELREPYVPTRHRHAGGRAGIEDLDEDLDEDR